MRIVRVMPVPLLPFAAPYVIDDHYDHAQADYRARYLYGSYPVDLRLAAAARRHFSARRIGPVIIIARACRRR